jgi:hypothetical protein
LNVRNSSSSDAGPGAGSTRFIVDDATPDALPNAP